LATLDDAEAIRDIYNVEVERSTATFDLVPRSIDDQRRWMAARSGAHVVVVAEDAGEVLGFGALSPYKDRPAYSMTVEDSVYVARHAHRRGVGRLLMAELLVIAARHGFHSVVARIEAGQLPSRQLHAAMGFELVGIEREVGRKFGRWLDVAIMQCMVPPPDPRA
jgi:phosphinothricin acetyltransferase